MSNPDARRSPAQARSILTWALPLLAVAAGLVLTVLAWQLARRQVESVQQQRFQRLNERLVSTTEARFASASQLVVSLRAALAAGGAATPAQWSAYVSETEPYFRDGVVGAGYIERVARTEVDIVEQRLRKEFNRPVAIQRLGTRDTLYVVTRIEPASRNADALGLDVGSGNTRRLAADRAAETNRAVLTQRIRIIEGNREIPGFLLFLPVYARDAALATTADRAAAVRGWVYASLRMDDLTRGFNAEADARLIDVRIDEDDRPNEPLFSTQVPNDARAVPQWPPESVHAIDLYGRTWTMHFTPRPGFATETEQVLPTLVAAGGTLVTLLAASLLWVLAGSRRRAVVLAGQMTAELSSANTSLEAAIEQARDLADQATQASKAKSRFLALMSHEIRTPMNGVIGMTDVLLDSPLTDRQREAADTIRTSGDALLRIIGDILDFSKIESGRMEVDPQPFDLHRCVTDARDLFSATAAAKALPLTLTLGPDVPVWVRGDSGRLRQVLLNLLGNAIKFTSSGSVSLSVTMSATKRVQFSIQDTGIGMSAETLGRILMPFAPADVSTTRTYGGTGLGLVISKELVALMGGELSLHSTSGAGTTVSFTLDLPAIAEREPSPAAGPPGGTRQLSDLRVLVADDNSVNRLVAQRTLQSMGIQPDLVADGAAVLARVAEANYDVLLLDVQMPELDGLEVARRLVASQPQRDRRPWMIALTANAVEGDRAACLDAGMDDYLAKPVKRADLESALGRIPGRM
ncbi:MAG: Autoinducer 2 sensor kinase/phosphatase LuxQ [Acidobacteriota bacterium]